LIVQIDFRDFEARKKSSIFRLFKKPQKVVPAQPAKLAAWGLDPVICEIPGAGPINFSANYVRLGQECKTSFADWHASFARENSAKRRGSTKRPFSRKFAPARKKSAKTRARSHARAKKRSSHETPTRNQFWSQNRKRAPKLNLIKN